MGSSLGWIHSSIWYAQRGCSAVAMVIIMNTRLDKEDDNYKWLGMGNQELLEYINEYPAVRARHSYGPQGRHGMTFLIFESSATGYFKADRLHRELAQKGLDRNAWWDRSGSWCSGDLRQLQYMASLRPSKIWMHSINTLKAEVRDEIVLQGYAVKEMRQIAEDNQQLKLTKQSNHTKVLEESLEILSRA